MGNHYEKLEHETFHEQVNSPFPIQYIQFANPWVITPIWDHLIPVRQVVPLVSHVCSYPPYHSHHHPPSHFLIPKSAIIAVHKIKWSLSISPWNDHELTPSTTYTKYSIHQVHHALSTTASTHDCLSSLNYHDYKLTPECSFSFWHASLQDRPPPALHESSKVKSPCHIQMVAN